MGEFLRNNFSEPISLLFYMVFLIIVAIFHFKKSLKNNSILSCTNLYIIFFYIFIALAPIGYVLFEKNFKYYYNTIFVFSFSLILFIIGSDFIVKNKNNIEVIKDNNVLNFKIIYNNALIFLIIGYIFSFIYLSKNLSYILIDFENNRVSAMSGNGIIIYLSYMIIPATLVLYYCHLHYKRNPMIFLYVLMNIIILLLFGFRARVLDLLVLILIIKNDYKSFRLSKLFNYGILAIIFVSFLQFVRFYISGSNSNTFMQSLFNTICVGSININFIIRYIPLKIPYQYGYTYAINFLQLLPSYSVDMTMWIKNTLNLQFDGGGVAPTILGELYINFGFIGLFLGSFILGIICKSIDNFAKKRDYGIKKIIYFIISFYLARSVYGGIANFIVLELWFIFIILFICNFKLKRGTIK